MSDLPEFDLADILNRLLTFLCMLMVLVLFLGPCVLMD